VTLKNPKMKKVVFEKRSHRKNRNAHERAILNPTKPPTVNYELQSSTTLRFVTTGTGGNTAVGVTYQNLLDAWFIAGTSTTAYQLFDYVKVRRVTVRALAASPQGSVAGAEVTVSVSYPGLVPGVGGSGKTKSDSALGSAVPALVSLKPDPKSPASMWQPTSADTAFLIRIQDATGAIVIGAMIDVELSYKNSPEVNPAAIASAIAGATPGLFYYGGIDGARLAATWARSVYNPRL